MGSSTLIQKLKKNAEEFQPVVPFAAAKDILCQLDFTENNHDLSDEILNDTIKFSEYINLKLADKNARYGIGGYAEHRTLYRHSKVFDAEKSGEEPRRLHLGIDIWGKPNTAVMAPLNGIVHSFAFNNAAGDYGATIILTYRLNDLSFYTLYGHLSLNSIKNLQEGQLILKGDIFAEFGIPSENGQWPPHLHFQIIADLQGWKGDYPGVCKLSESEKWLSNCPDPDLILQMNQYL